MYYKFSTTALHAAIRAAKKHDFEASVSQLPMSEPESESESEPEPPPAKPVRISLKMLEEAVLPDSFDGDTEARAERLFQVRKLRLKGRNIIALENLEMFTALEYLYLGHNKIEQLENLEFHPHLLFLTVNHNRLGSLSGIEAAPNLKHLNAASNLLQSLADVVNILPPGLEDLLLAGNPAALEENYRYQLVGALPELVELDEIAVTNDELAAFGFDKVVQVDGEGEAAEGVTNSDELHTLETTQPSRVANENVPGCEGGSALEMVAEDADAEPLPDPSIMTNSAANIGGNLNYEATAAAMAEEVIAPFRARRQVMSERSKQRQKQLLSELPQ